MSVRFVKMSGAGNDFIVIEAAVAQQLGAELERWVQAVCRRGLSVGADGLLVVERVADLEVGVRFLNPDGTQAFCGNGSRCAARYAAARYGLEPGVEFMLQTCAGSVPARVQGSRVRLRLPAPVERGSFVLSFEDVEHTAILIEAGTPHLLVQVADLEHFPLSRFAARFRSDRRFGEGGVNVNAWALEGSQIRLRTWEKGVEGETLACGSGAVAAAAAARLESARSEFRITPRSGIPIDVRFENSGELCFEGEVRWIFEGQLADEATAG